MKKIYDISKFISTLLAVAFVLLIATQVTLSVFGMHLRVSFELHTILLLGSVTFRITPKVHEKLDTRTNSKSYEDYFVYYSPKTGQYVKVYFG